MATSEEIYDWIESQDVSYPPPRIIVFREAVQDGYFPRASAISQDIQKNEFGGKVYWCVENIGSCAVEVANCFDNESIPELLDSIEESLEDRSRPTFLWSTFDINRELWNEGRAISEIKG